MTPHRARTIHLCYLGVREPLVQTQVLPYLRAVAASGVEVTLLTFEPRHPAWAPGELDGTARALAAAGIAWHRRRYHKRPSIPATAVDVAVGALFVRRASSRAPVEVLHARGHVPALMAALGARSRQRLLFDVRGLLAEEYVDAGVWRPGGAVVRTVRAVERWLLRRADAAVVLTGRARDLLTERLSHRPGGPPPIEVIPCCVDLGAFPLPAASVTAAAKRRLGVDGRPVVLYVGSTTGAYRTGELVDFVLALREAEPDLFLLVLTQRGVGRVADLLAGRGLGAADCAVRAVRPAEVAAHAAAADVGLCFVEPTYAKLASSPTKVAEYLACGLPVVATAGVGDLDAQIAAARVGVLVRDHDRAGHRRAVADLRDLLADPGLPGRCRATARALFDLETVGGPRYVALYDRLVAGVPR
jgi:glycosyltransferase involved in cell wall biosynthesis